MRQDGHDVSEVVDLPLVIETELDEIVRQPLKFARWYLTGVGLNNLVLMSGLIAA